MKLGNNAASNIKKQSKILYNIFYVKIFGKYGPDPNPELFRGRIRIRNK